MSVMRETRSFFTRSSLFCALLSLTMSILSRVLFDTPLAMLHTVKGVRLLPPIWVFNIISYAWAFLIGLAAGAIIEKTSLRENNGIEEIHGYKGGIFFVSVLFLNLILYQTFFLFKMLFVSVLISAICMICTLFCATMWRRVRPPLSSFIMFCFATWQFYLFFVCLSVFLYN